MVYKSLISRSIKQQQKVTYYKIVLLITILSKKKTGRVSSLLIQNKINSRPTLSHTQTYTKNPNQNIQTPTKNSHTTVILTGTTKTKTTMSTCWTCRKHLVAVPSSLSLSLSLSLTHTLAQLWFRLY